MYCIVMVGLGCGYMVSLKSLIDWLIVLFYCTINCIVHYLVWSEFFVLYCTAILYCTALQSCILLKFVMFYFALLFCKVVLLLHWELYLIYCTVLLFTSGDKRLLPDFCHLEQTFVHKGKLRKGTKNLKSFDFTFLNHRSLDLIFILDLNSSMLHMWFSF